MPDDEPQVFDEMDDISYTATGIIKRKVFRVLNYANRTVILIADEGFEPNNNPSVESIFRGNVQMVKIYGATLEIRMNKLPQELSKFIKMNIGSEIVQQIQRRMLQLKRQMRDGSVTSSGTDSTENNSDSDLDSWK